MPMRNRRVRLLLLAIVLVTTFVLYSRSDPTTIEGAKKYAQRTYQQAYDQTIGKSKSQQEDNQGQDPLVQAAEPPKKDEPFRVDFGAYSKAAAAEETEAPGTIPPPAAAVPPPPPPKAEPAPAPVEPKKDDPMRVDFAAYSKAANAEPEETLPPGGKKEVIANPNPIVGVVGAPDPPAPAPKATSSAAKADAKGKTNDDSGKLADSVRPIGEGRMEIDVSATATGAPVHWSKRTERFPISSTITFPFGEKTPIPRIQHEFKKTAGSGADKEKLEAIKAAAAHSWKGYREKAMGHDEVKPVSGKFANPFNAWGATLVDSLDTLWMMGMIPEFEEALEWVAKIDFTTSKRADIPLFETTIRYMGGLLGAYEISSYNYKVLLDQAKQLGEILYGAFDTPNRMPMTYYQWKPAFASQGHRAPVKAILAEIGSLSLEFTRLGQLAGEVKYYDAVAKITNALEEWQSKTRIPGLWPTELDASGCKKLPSTDVDEMKSYTKATVPETKLKNVDPDPLKPATPDARIVKSESSGSTVGGKQPGIGKIPGFGDPLAEGSLDAQASRDSVLQAAGITKMVKRALEAVGLSKRAFDPRTGTTIPDAAPAAPADSLSNSALSGIIKEASHSTNLQTPLTDDDDCVPQGLQSTNPYNSDIFTLGAAADSTYEYLPKMYLLLGGHVDQYRTMYKKAAEASKKWLLFRAMIPDENRELLFAGNVDTRPASIEKGEFERDFKPVMSHLTCFVGGMFAMSGKIFNNPEDVEIGAKLTDGCIWAYNSTTTGIMPEVLGLHKCESMKECKWNKTAYYEALDPYQSLRLQHSGSKSSEEKTPDPRAVLNAATKAAAQKGSHLEKRQYGGGEMQYGAQSGPDGLSGAAATIISEVPPRELGHSGFSGAGESADDLNIKSPYDSGASAKLPTEGVPKAGAVNGAPYPAAPDANAKVASTFTDAKDKVPVTESKEFAKGDKDRIPPAVPDTKMAPTASDSKLGSTVSDSEAVAAVPGSGVAPTVPKKGANNAGGSAFESKHSADDDHPATSAKESKTSTKDPLSHEAFVEDKIKTDRLPIGMTAMYNKQYLLRPEAIESVFYMYRITGQQYWRDRGWEMWQAIHKHTAAPFGASAVEDVSKPKPEQHDSEESFWLAETLKYFYLLFDDPDRYSLDDWVLNTEAHFFARLGT